MRTKDEISHMLKCMEINHDIISTSEHQRAEILMEVLCDIRDMIELRAYQIIDRLSAISDKD